MDWNKWSDLFDHEYNTLCWKRPRLHTLLKLRDDHLNWGDTFGELEEKHGRKVHAAVLKFAETRKWPKMSDVVVALLGERLSFAMGFVEQLQWTAKKLGFNFPEVEKTDDEMVCWLLIDVWDYFGYNDLELHLMQIPCVETTATRELKATLWKDVKPIRPDQN